MKYALFILSLLFSTSPLLGEERHVQEYLEFLKNHGHLAVKGDYTRGEIELVTNPKRIKDIEALQKSRYLKMGESEEYAVHASKIGIIAQDMYWTWIRDPVVFPTGAEGTYDRIILARNVEDGIAPGVAVLPVLPDGRLILNLNYRHATRNWELEVPRGARKADEPIDVAAKRELEEETGFYVTKVSLLGNMIPDSGAMSSVIPIYIGTVSKKGISNQDYSEAILRVEAFSLDDIKEALSKGSMILDIKGKKEKVSVRDSFLSFAILQAEYKKLL